MAEVLSQSEIDALLSGLSSGEIEPEAVEKENEKQKVRKYDFRTPNRFSKDHIRTLELAYENYCKITSTYLSGYLRKSVKCNIEIIQQFTYEEFINSIPNPTVLTTLSADPLEGALLYEANLDFAGKVVDILLGGTGERSFKQKDLTDIDKSIIYKFNQDMLSNMKLAWEDILDIDVLVKSIETNPALNPTFAPTETVLVITFLLEVGEEFSTYTNLCIPFFSIENVLDKLDIQNWLKSNRVEVKESEGKDLEDNIKNAEVELSGVLGETNIKVSDFLNLAIGDVVVLDKNTQSPVEVSVGNQTFFHAKAGKSGKFKGMQIIDIIDEDVC